ncbi:hypothetical protein [Lichenifustis flavocetrariae]|uniref:Uncharacterized protein n=1 Tax=Lichenifustis flavocetrariae TaxID=2949735 RepID=A0AA41YVX9_9HYPH|nr:hypothetical protein [Lichenifustis flavocetrariae]MCW6509599.1 hypothetical protein [Lichenifustis flavocetrariae]
MTSDPRTLKNIEVLVLRADKPRIGYTWELRQYGKGTPIIASDDLFPSQVEARRSGLEAFAKFMAAG